MNVPEIKPEYTCEYQDRLIISYGTHSQNVLCENVENDIYAYENFYEKATFLTIEFQANKDKKSGRGFKMDIFAKSFFSPIEENCGTIIPG